MQLRNERDVHVEITVATNKGKVIHNLFASNSNVHIFERKILKRIYGPMFNVDLGVLERRKNKDLQRL
jgi:hypothetical protein